MATTENICGPCEYRHETKFALKWCADCDEALCSACSEHHASSKMSRNHHIIPIEDYIKIAPIVDVCADEVCKEHNTPLDFFCLAHEDILCISCIQANHNLCKGWIPVKKAAVGVKSSVALSSLEQDLLEAVNNVESLIKDHKNQTALIESEKKKLKGEVDNILQQLNEKIHRLGNETLEKLESEHTSVAAIVKGILDKLETKLQDLHNFKKQLDDLKAHGSELQVFVNMRQLAKHLNTKLDAIKSLAGMAKKTSVLFKLNSTFHSVLHEVTSLGEISSNILSIPFQWTTRGKEQFHITGPEYKSMADIKVKSTAILTIYADTECSETMNIWSGIILPNKQMMFSDGTANVIVYDADGKLVDNIEFESAVEYLTVVDSSRIAFSSDDNSVVIYNIQEQTYEKIEMFLACLGIAFHKILFAVTNTVLYMKNIHIDQLPVPLPVDTMNSEFLVVEDNYIYYTDPFKNVLRCCDINGKDIWTYQHDAMLQPRGVAIDSRKNLYVSGQKSNNVMVVSPDGQKSKVLLTQADGLDGPYCLFYEKQENRLLVCNNQHGKVVVCDLT